MNRDQRKIIEMHIHLQKTAQLAGASQNVNLLFGQAC